MRLKPIKGGTSKDHTVSLCDTCHHSRVVQGHSVSQRLVHCTEIYFGGKNNMDLVPFPIAECASYTPKMTMTLYQMQQIGYILDDKGGKYGFRRPTDQEKRGDYD